MYARQVEYTYIYTLQVEVFLNKLLGISPAAAQQIFTFFTICVDCARQKARQSGQPLEAEGSVDLRDVEGRWA